MGDLGDSFCIRENTEHIDDMPGGGGGGELEYKKGGGARHLA